MFKKKKEYFYLEPDIKEEIEKIIETNKSTDLFNENISFSAFVRKSVNFYLCFLKRKLGGKCKLK